MKERDFWNKIKENLKLEYMARVENELEPGWADVHYINNSYTGWIELKAEETLPEKIKFEVGQPLWLTNYWNKGGCCYVFLHVQKDNQIYIWAGRDALRLNVDCRSIEPLLQVAMNPVGWKFIYELFNQPPIHLRETA